CGGDTLVVSGLSLKSPGAYMRLGPSRHSLGRGFIEVLGGEFIEAFKTMWPGLEPSGVQRAAFKLLSTMAVEGGTLVILAPTGSGKSAIFQVASRVLASNGLGCYTLIVSPLRALMRDQVYRASIRGLKAFYIDSSVPPSRRRLILEAVGECLVDMLYVAPERFFSPEFREFLEEKPPALIVLDEAHAMAEWGLSFRPSYLYMAGVLTSYRARRGFKPPVIALSATLTKTDLDSVLKALGHRGGILELEEGFEGYVELKPSKPVVLRSEVLRRNIAFRIIPAPTGYERLKVLLENVKKLVEWSRSLGAPWVGLVYTGFVESSSVEWARVDEVVKALKNSLDTPVYAYHGKMSPARRQRVEELFSRGSLWEA
ncbi:MAG: DEAD/DEAH box helicase, partial [Acidilobaceae archaeon]